MNPPRQPVGNLPYNCAPFLVGAGTLAPTDAGVRLILPHASRRAYSNAQLDDYSGRPRRRLSWRPPLRLSLRARFSHPRILGTAGFGFWNDPFTPLGGIPALPRAVWFFYASPPSNMALAQHVPGSGWKAACLDALRPTALAWAPLAPLVLALNQIAPCRQLIWPRVQRALCIHEAALDARLDAWHTYELHWQPACVTFAVDGAVVLQTDCAPGGPLGFVAWLDNQYAIVTPRGRIGWGLLEVTTPQWLELADLQIKDMEQDYA